MSLRHCFVAIVACWLPLGSVGAYAGAADLDTTYGPSQTGQVLTSIGVDVFSRAAMRQADDKLVVVGITQSLQTGKQIALIRYTIDGIPDPAFGTDGVVHSNFPSSVDPYSATLQNDGSIVIGAVQSSSTNCTVVLVRYLNEGTLDVQFGMNGLLTLTELTCVGAAPRFIHSADASHFLVVTDKQVASYDVTDGNGIGVLDATYGDFGSGLVNQNIMVFNAAVQADGKLLLVGRYQNDTALMRLNADGSPDPNFGTGGYVVSNFDVNDLASAAAFQPDGKIVIGGTRGSAGQLPMVARYFPNGQLDAGFGINGVRSIGQNGSSVRTVLVQADAKILIMSRGSSFFEVFRLTSSGSSDYTFENMNGSYGALINFRGWYDEAAGMFFQDDGKLILGGISYTTSNTSPIFAAARLNGRGDADLAVSLVSPKGPFKVGATINYSATAVNNGVDTAWNVNVSFPVPVGTTVVSASANPNPNSNCELPAAGATAGAISCVIPFVLAGETHTVGLEVTAVTSGAVSATVSASSTSPDPVLSNNSATSSVKVNGPGKKK